MPLATPTSLTISRLFADGKNGSIPDSLGGMDLGTVTYLPGPSVFEIFGSISWQNTETNPHTVEVTIGTQKIYLPKGSTSFSGLFGQTKSSTFQNYVNPTGTTTLFVSVQLRGESGDSSVLSGSAVINMTANAELSGSLNFGTALEIPNWSNVAWNPTFAIYDENGKVIKNGKGKIGWQSEVSGNEYGTFDLVAGKTYRAEFVLGYGFNRKVITKTIPSIHSGGQPLVYNFYYYTQTSNRTQTLFFSPDPAESSFAAVSEALQILRGSRVRIRLKASHEASFAINSGAPDGFVITTMHGIVGNEFYLEGTATTLGTYSISITATRYSDSTTANSTITLTIVSSESPINRIQIITNPGWLNNGLSYTAGDTVSVALASNPAAGVLWSATGLPSGLVLDESTGLISGKLTTAGRFLAAIVASPAPGTSLQASLPAAITFTVRDAATPPGGGGNEGGGSVSQPSDRIPWILSEWTLTDLQVLARTRAVQSTLLDSKTGLRIKVGDNVNFAVFFIGADDRPFELSPDRLRVTIRPGDNLEGALVFESEDSPAAVTTEADPYYLLAASTSGRQRQVVQEWVEDSGKNEPLACVADIDWTKDSQHFSSASFPVLLELDVTRP